MHTDFKIQSLRSRSGPVKNAAKSHSLTAFARGLLYDGTTVIGAFRSIARSSSSAIALPRDT
ncbi:hypothetical protein SAMN04488694_103201 [Natrinema hispanicum]|uniref:Uncharacterized protein n=1 Tax=Natrinema hispanicum TaxID=392421 RepID=A0A1I0BDG0_9EURY|nr:hypothetical protein SAMN04488694_103201 [Natrinema hispanicum]